MSIKFYFIFKLNRKIFNQENDLLNLRQAETSADVHDNNNDDESNHALVRGFSTLQRHVSLRLHNISKNLKKDTQENNNTNGTPIDTIMEEETSQLTSHDDELRV